MKKNCTIPIFIPELACPFQCIYCNQKKISSTLKIPDLQDIHQIISNHLSTIDYNNSNVQIAFFGGNFTGIDINYQIQLLEIASSYIQKYNLTGIRISTRPDYIDYKKLELLKIYNVNAIELGAQSLVDEVLKKAGRGHSSKDVIEASKIINDMNFELGLQMMIGLPGDTKEFDIYTAQKIVELGAKTTRIYPTLVIKDTKLEEMYQKGKYNNLTLEQAIDIVKTLIPIFEENNVKILRVGLHPSEDLINQNSLVAGPFHPSFKELVLTEIWFDKIKILPDLYGFKSQIIIYVHPKSINYAIGHKAKNKLYLQNYFQNLKFKVDDTLGLYEMKVITN